MSAQGNVNSEPTRVALYTRAAGSGPDAQPSMGEQQQALQAYADANGMVVVAIYADAGVSGRSKDPAELNRLMQDARSQPRPFDKVLVWSFDRFGRRLNTMLGRITELEGLGIDIAVIQPPIEGKPSIMRFMRIMLGGFAEYLND